MRQRYEDAVAYLRRVARGEVNLSLDADDDGPQAPQASGTTVCTSDRSRTIRDAVDDFRGDA